MSYGFIITNTNDQTVINDSEPLFVRKRSGTLSNSGTTNLGIYKFFYSGGASATSEEIVLFSCSVGSWISFNLPLGDNDYFGDLCSDQSTLSYSVFGPRNDLPTPTGYGMAVFNSSGQTMWDSESVLTRVNNAGIIPAATNESTTFQSSTISGSNAVFCAAGSAFLLTSDGQLPQTDGYYQIAAERSGTNSWFFFQRRITFENTSGLLGKFTSSSDFSYILGTT